MILDHYPSIRTDGSNRFAYETIKNRIPGILEELIDLNAHFPETIKERVRELRRNIIEDESIPMLEPTAWDYDFWEAAWSLHRGSSWLNAEWFFAENFLYRHLIQAIRYWDFGWDPFYPYKEKEFAGDNLWNIITTGLSLATGNNSSAPDPKEVLSGLLGLSLWGNRIDLSYKASAAHGSDLLDPEDLIVNHTDEAVETITEGSGPVHLITDNAGSELTADLVLADYLLQALEAQVFFHVKLYPTYVSDATAIDIDDHIRRMQEHRDNAIQQLGERLMRFRYAERLRVIPDPYWNSPFFLFVLPKHIRSLLESARVVILKGDVNYRRLLKDAQLPTDTSFDEAITYFPAPVLVLRTMKSDVIIGLQPSQAEKLDAQDPWWRNNGRRGIIQHSAQHETQYG